MKPLADDSFPMGIGKGHEGAPLLEPFLPLNQGNCYGLHVVSDKEADECEMGQDPLRARWLRAARLVKV